MRTADEDGVTPPAWNAHTPSLQRHTPPINIIIAGVGGQGVYTLTRVFCSLCVAEGLKFQSQVMKGGAQQLGAIHSTLRVFKAHVEHYDRYCPSVPPGELNLLLGLEPWESVRFLESCGPSTTILSNTHMFPLVGGPAAVAAGKNPLELLRRTGCRVVLRDFSSQALEEHGCEKMANFLIGLEALRDSDLPFSEDDFIGAFNEAVSGKHHADASTRARQGPAVRGGTS